MPCTKCSYVDSRARCTQHPYSQFRVQTYVHIHTTCWIIITQCPTSFDVEPLERHRDGTRPGRTPTDKILVNPCRLAVAGLTTRPRTCTPSLAAEMMGAAGEGRAAAAAEVEGPAPAPLARCTSLCGLASRMSVSSLQAFSCVNQSVRCSSLHPPHPQSLDRTLHRLGLHISLHSCHTSRDDQTQTVEAAQ